MENYETNNEILFSLELRAVCFHVISLESTAWTTKMEDNFIFSFIILRVVFSYLSTVFLVAK